MDTLTWMVVLVGCAAAFDDLRRRSISNWISGAAVISGLGFHAIREGWGGFGTGLIGGLVGFGVFFLFYFLGGLGGGDVKLMAGFGTMLGPSLILVSAVFAALIGAVMAAASLLLRPGRPSIPYGPSIVVGVWASLLARS